MKAQSRVQLELLAVCLMPNHFHMVVRPRAGADLSRWMHWLLTTHARRYRLRRGATGHVWQGRYKAFPAESDGYLLTVLRYVERNPLRARLVERAEEWRWGSLHWRSSPRRWPELASPPVTLPEPWIEYVNEPQSERELEAIRHSVNRERPYGSTAWAETTATQLGLPPPARPRGRPARSS